MRKDGAQVARAIFQSPTTAGIRTPRGISAAKSRGAPMPQMSPLSRLLKNDEVGAAQASKGLICSFHVVGFGFSSLRTLFQPSD
jgi:hypothetical protein